MMRKRFLVILVVVGLVLALASAWLFPSTLAIQAINYAFTLGSLILGMIAAAIAARALLGRGTTTRSSRLLVPLLSAISYAALSSALSSVLLSSHILDSLSAVGESLSGAFVAALVIGAVAYLAAATIYGFVGTAQGVGVGSRIGLLLLLLLAVVPVLDVLGMIGFLICALVRGPGDADAVDTEVIREPEPTA